MKKNIYIFLFLIFSTQTFAQTDSLTIINLESKLIKLINVQKASFDKDLSEIRTFKSNHNKILDELSRLKKSHNTALLKLDSLEKEQLALFQRDSKLKKRITNLKNQLNNKVNGLKTETNQLGIVTSTLSEGLTTAKNDVSEIAESSSKNQIQLILVNQALSQKQQYGLIFIGLFLILVLTIYIILTKRQNTTTKKLAAKQQEIFEKQIEDSLQLANWLSEQTSDNFVQSSGGEIDHSFAKRVADEIVRITTNLSRMDSTIKGYKQLSASVRKLEQSLNSNGYELEVLLNKPYDNGMNLQANFVIDENLKEGESVITRVIKPQINFKGILIQAAQVEVSQGE